MDPKRVFLMAFFSFLGLNPHDIAKNHPNFENNDLFYAKFYKA